MLKEGRRQHPRSIEKDTLWLAESGIGVVQRRAESRRVGDVDSVRLDVDLCADGLLKGGLFSRQRVGASGDKHDIIVTLGRKESSHGTADAWAGADDNERFA